MTTKKKKCINDNQNNKITKSCCLNRFEATKNWYAHTYIFARVIDWNV